MRLNSLSLRMAVSSSRRFSSILALILASQPKSLIIRTAPPMTVNKPSDQVLYVGESHDLLSVIV